MNYSRLRLRDGTYSLGFLLNGSFSVDIRRFLVEEQEDDSAYCVQ